MHREASKNVKPDIALNDEKAQISLGEQFILRLTEKCVNLLANSVFFSYAKTKTDQLMIVSKATLNAPIAGINPLQEGFKMSKE